MTSHFSDYYAVIFTSTRTPMQKGYEEMAIKMVELAEQQKGFLGIESVQDSSLGITVSYWESLEDITQWRNHAAHKMAQEKGKSEWYDSFSLRVCKIEREHHFKRERLE
ncbi:antibiotic biosynthesis monooxygenase [Priestia koreensis]|uniref:antibiotic biosynthesis monooxygenase family protein n=1 Tax=Priestia koreensis TaxID=284581 RepID=UPI0028F724B9|nr:antibiotic biosynthesis monooxygenase [Priestia koreensis]